MADGTYQHCRHAGRSFGLEGAPVKPNDLDEYGEYLWSTTIDELISAGVVKQVDTLMLIEMCRWYSDFRRWHDSKELAPWRSLPLSRAAWKEFNSIASRMGLTPVDREKIRRTPPDEVSDPLSKFG